MGECLCSAAHACNGHKSCAVAQSARAWQDFYADKAGSAGDTQLRVLIQEGGSDLVLVEEHIGDAGGYGKLSPCLSAYLGSAGMR